MEKGSKTALQLVGEAKMACNHKDRALRELKHELQELRTELKIERRQGLDQAAEISSLREKLEDAEVLREDLFWRCGSFDFERCRLLERQAELATRMAQQSALLEELEEKVDQLECRRKKKRLLGSLWVAGVGVLGSLVLLCI